VEKGHPLAVTGSRLCPRAGHRSGEGDGDGRRRTAERQDVLVPLLWMVTMRNASKSIAVLLGMGKKRRTPAEHRGRLNPLRSGTK